MAAGRSTIPHAAASPRTPRVPVIRMPRSAATRRADFSSSDHVGADRFRHQNRRLLPRLKFLQASRTARRILLDGNPLREIGRPGADRVRGIFVEQLHDDGGRKHHLTEELIKEFDLVDED
jgi:hypothetical protein